VTAIPRLCTRTDLEDLLSIQGAVAFADDEDDTDAHDAILWAIDTASSDICLMLSRRYTPQQLQQSIMIRRWAAVYACRTLCQRRGNGVPQSVLDRVSEIDEHVERLMTYRSDLPDVTDSNVRTPSVVTLRVDNRFYVDRLRVVDQQSTGPVQSALGRRNDIDQWFSWFFV
jgi:hypothetical protein